MKTKNSAKMFEIMENCPFLKISYYRLRQIKRVVDKKKHSQREKKVKNIYNVGSNIQHVYMGTHRV